jgi:hypothetical protein
MSRLTKRPPGRMAEYPERRMCMSGKDGLLKILLMSITAVMSQENAAWNKDVVEEQVSLSRRDGQFKVNTLSI